MLLSSSIRKLAAFASTFLLSGSFCEGTNNQFPFIELHEFNANEPIEDRSSFAKLTAINGYTASVFDGHGGSLVAEYASKNLNRCLDDRIKGNTSLKLSTEQMIQKSLTEAYEDVQNGFFTIFKQKIGDKKYKKVGSCALTAVILKDSLHIGNAGDCEGLLLSDKEAVKTNLRLNAGETFEQERLRKEFPDEPDIYLCKSACYVKGRLQPTRSLGDFYLKYKEFNFTNLKVFTGPYIDYRPLVTHFKLTKEHQNLLLATDGLWDELNANTIHQVYLMRKDRGVPLGKAVFSTAIAQVLLNTGVESMEKLKTISGRRDMHDDITLLNINIPDLRNTL